MIHLRPLVYVKQAIYCKVYATHTNQNERKFNRTFGNYLFDISSRLDILCQTPLYQFIYNDFLIIVQTNQPPNFIKSIPTTVKLNC